MIVVRCQDCAVVCRNAATWRVREAESAGEWFYCDDHVPDRDPGVELSAFAQEPT